MTSGAPRFPPRVRILYEDSRAATRGFGLASVVDGGDRPPPSQRLGARMIAGGSGEGG